MLFLCISSELSRSCVWCAEAHGGRVATLNVCNPHKEIVSGRSGPVNSFLACQPCSYPTSQRWAITSDHIYFLDTFYTHAHTHIYTPFLPPQTPLLQQDRTSSVCNHTHTGEHPPSSPKSHPRAFTLTHTHIHVALLPKWCVWDSDGDSHNNISTCCGTQERHREAAADAALTAPGLPRPAQTPSRPLLPRYTQAGRKHSAGPLFTQDPLSPTLGLQTTQQQGRVQDQREQKEGWNWRQRKGMEFIHQWHPLFQVLGQIKINNEPINSVFKQWMTFYRMKWLLQLNSLPIQTEIHSWEVLFSLLCHCWSFFLKNIF